MQIRDLEYFVKLAELKNFTQVAQFFQVSQPTITYAIKRVEQSVDGNLIHRDQSHHSVDLTPEGQQFVIHAHNILEELDLAIQEVAQDKIPKIKLGLPPIIGSHFFPRFVPALNQANLIQSLVSTSVGSQELLDLLLAGNLDLAFIGASQPLDSSRLHLDLLAAYDFNIIASSANPLGDKSVVDYKTLVRQPFVVFNENFSHDKVFAEMISHHRHKPRVIYRASDVNILKSMVVQNAGVALLTSLAIDSSDQLQALTLKDYDPPKFKVYLAYRQDYLLSEVEKQFIAIVKDAGQVD
ncbi:transcriptional regulator, LysR family [Agrilactobacillus composti DSM 18527 = JCM 14202]|uniref:Transcriptional regulator, LysR family n=1 Tax=Agrilactobacillus composti DSM 18527 = JCM 14202 TaxID=1423734 RepID=A0A0R1XR53_9LACO|nr:LysR substrate-binding domain-containing protein [Agrilactobacillus composti]KRM32728.1 transcriptional regulator, LysR family [Agrilactobacillus composti DSM 18527 = JCM 14202]